MSREMVPMWDTLNNMGLDRARGGNISVNIPRRGI
jgi:ribulose-5-phosphate 4-epimerase/fuculose-1-phosphate aldolase